MNEFLMEEDIIIRQDNYIELSPVETFIPVAYFLIFILISLISRGLRFYIVAYLSFKFGDMFTQFMNKHGSKSFTVVGIFIVILGLIIYLIFKSYV